MKESKKSLNPKNVLPYRIMTKEEEDIISDIQKTKMALETAYVNFQNVTEPELIDYYIYELQAIQVRYAYLLSLAKSKDIRVKIQA